MHIHPRYLAPMALSAFVIACTPERAAPSAPSQTQYDTEALVAQAQDVVERFQTALKTELVSAMQAGGPQHAVSVCEAQAPKIAQGIEAETGWRVQRVALKTRNPANQPTDTQRVVLEQFDQALRTGVGASIPHHSFVTDKRWVYMRPISTQGVCLTCHGQNVDADLLANIQSHYPDDLATGFAEGDLRGAFVISAPLDTISLPADTP